MALTVRLHEIERTQNSHKTAQLTLLTDPGAQKLERERTKLGIQTSRYSRY
jgi:hypothetical protein